MGPANKSYTLPDTSSQSSEAIDAGQMVRVSCQVSFADTTAAGTVKLQASNDNVNWSDIPNTSQTVASGALTLIPSTEICYRWIRFAFTETTPGTSTLTAVVNGLVY